MTIYFKNERRKDPWRSLEIRNQVGRNQSITQLLQPAGPAEVALQRSGQATLIPGSANSGWEPRSSFNSAGGDSTLWAPTVTQGPSPERKAKAANSATASKAQPLTKELSSTENNGAAPRAKISIRRALATAFGQAVPL